MPRHPTFAPLVLVLTVWVGAGAGEATMLASATPEQRKLYDEAKALILKGAQSPPKTLTESKEDYFWLWDAKLRPLAYGYEYAHDVAFIEAFVPLMESIISQRFIHPTKPEWNGWWHYQESEKGTLALVDHDAILYFVPVLNFVRAVRGDPQLQVTYSAKAEAWLKDVEVSIRAWDKRGCWHDIDDQTGWYGNITEYPDKAGNIIKNPTIFSGGTVPYNKVSALYEALALAYRVTGDNWYKVRMEKSAKFWRDHWRSDDKHIEWNYRDHFLPTDYKSGVVGQGETLTGAFIHPHSGYYSIDVTASVYLYDIGIAFTRPDMERFINTHLNFMWRQDMPPTFKNVNGTDGKNKDGYLWVKLAHFDPKIRELWKAQLDKPKRHWTWHTSVIEYLIEVSQPISWEPRFVNEVRKK
ncbi:MAG: hypothetical protein AAB263_03670 [Planctomycetota bacterium]